MTEVKHTPGPYGLKVARGRYLIVAPHPDLGSIIIAELKVANLHHNGHLLAAAPEMLEAALPIVAEIAHYEPSAGEDDDEIVPIRLVDIKRLRSAISAAEGRDHGKGEG